MSEKPRILIAGDSLQNITGLAYVATSFMRYFIQNGYEVGYVVFSGNDSNSKDLEKFHIDYCNEKMQDSLPVYNCQYFDYQKSNKINDVILDFQPDIIISFLDPWKLDQLAYTVYRHKFFWVVYTTIEVPRYSNYVMFPTAANQKIRKSLTEILQKADMVIPVTNMAKKALEELNVIATDHIYNGIDFSLVQDSKNHSKVDVFKGMVDKNTFIFMTMGVNSERKQISKVIESYAKFLDKIGRNKNVKLYIHSNTDEQKNGADLVTMIIELDLVNHVLLPLDLSQGKQDSRIDLYKKYSVIDCYIGLPAGEGFGYGFAEAISHKKPVIYIDYGGHTDYLNGIGLPVKVKDYIYMGHSHIKLAIPDTDHAAKQMARVYSDVKFRESMGPKGYGYAKNNFDWADVFKKLETTINTKYISYVESKSILAKINAKKII